jgi:hypothetical protein
MNGLLDVLQGASNAAASNVSGPVDGIAWLLRKAGIPLREPIGGSEWMAKKGLTAQPQSQPLGLLGEALGMSAPIAAAAKAPQIARGLLKVGENAAAPRAMNPQKGAIVYHGSPHKFDAFDATKAGTEGGTSFGLGHNFSADPAHAAAYAKREPGGSIYKVDIPDSEIAGFMKWERPFADQPANVAAFSNTLPKELPDVLPFGGGASVVKTQSGWRLTFGPNDKGFSLSEGEVRRMFGNAGTGEQVYRRLVAHLGGDERAANEALRRAGVKGIENNVERGTRNFVVFPGEENMLKILERNGLAP